MSGVTFEMMQVALDDEETFAALSDVAEIYARAQVSEQVARGLSLGHLTALRKDNGRVRGIVAGDALRRLIVKTLSSNYF